MSTILIFRLTFSEFCESCNCRQWPWTPLATRKCDGAMKPGKLHTTSCEALVGELTRGAFVVHTLLSQATRSISLLLYKILAKSDLFLRQTGCHYTIIKLCSFTDTNTFRTTTFVLHAIQHRNFSSCMIRSKSKCWTKINIPLCLFWNAVVAYSIFLLGSVKCWGLWKNAGYKQKIQKPRQEKKILQ